MDIQPEKKSMRIVWIVAGALIALVVVVGAVLYFMLGAGTKPETAQTSPSPSASPEATVATKEQVKQNLSDLDTSIKQAVADQAAAKAAIKDSSKQVKVGD